MVPQLHSHDANAVQEGLRKCHGRRSPSGFDVGLVLGLDSCTVVMISDLNRKNKDLKAGSHIRFCRSTADPEALCDDTSLCPRSRRTAWA